MNVQVSIVVFYRKKIQSIEFVMFPRIGSKLLEFPGGKIEKNETSLECAIREVKEEVNLVLDPLKCFFYKISKHHHFKIASYLYEYDFDQKEGIVMASLKKDLLYFPKDIEFLKEIEVFLLQ